MIVTGSTTVTNSGTATANTGGNTAIGNNSVNGATVDQQIGGTLRPDGVASNNATTANNSTGSSGVTTGAADATGNIAQTNVVQTIEANATGTLGGILVVAQDAHVSNVGTAVANTGDNVAIGNQSLNGASTDQSIGGIRNAVASNTAATNTNSSGGDATISTGNATATGNVSSTAVTQVIRGTVGGSLGGIAVVGQNASVVNDGLAVANSGNNQAIGNNSENAASTTQGIGSARGPPVASNLGSASNSSTGSASVTTGAADAVGNVSDTTIAQSSSITMIGRFGIAVANQTASIQNIGDAVANTGDNRAIGNNSFNGAATCQVIASDCFGGPVGDGPRRFDVASNDGSSTNSSGGVAGITTGNASAVGNDARSAISQTSSTAFTGGGIVVSSPSASVLNQGVALANTGDNDARGNNSFNTAATCQAIAGSCEEGGAGGFVRRIAVASNQGSSSNSSTGSAGITTGSADALGNQSTTNIASSITGSVLGAFGIAVVSPTIDVINFGDAIANTGGNNAIGNNSLNDAFLCQAIATDCDGVAGELRRADVATNSGNARNESSGESSIVTGNASALGNTSTTGIRLTLSAPLTAPSPFAGFPGLWGIGGAHGALVPAFGGIAVVNPTLTVVNNGIADAISGANQAIGNNSWNTATVIQEIAQAVRLVTASNIISGLLNSSTGLATIRTGTATALGNQSETGIELVG